VVEELLKNGKKKTLLLLISSDTKGYKMRIVEALTHGKGTGRLVYGKHTAMAAASRNIEQKLPEQSLAKDALIDDKIGSRPEKETLTESTSVLANLYQGKMPRH